jgi:hypothetical protein
MTAISVTLQVLLKADERWPNAVTHLEFDEDAVLVWLDVDFGTMKLKLEEEYGIFRITESSLALKEIKDDTAIESA